MPAVPVLVDRDPELVGERLGLRRVRFQIATCRARVRAAPSTTARAEPPAPSTSARLPAGGSGSAAISPVASVLSASIPPAVKLSVFAAPISRAAAEARSATASAASLCGTVTLTPAKSVAARASGRAPRSPPARPRSPRSSTRRASPSSASAAFCIAGERECETGWPRTARRAWDDARARRCGAPRCAGRHASSVVLTTVSVVNATGSAISGHVVPTDRH